MHFAEAADATHRIYTHRRVLNPTARHDRSSVSFAQQPDSSLPVSSDPASSPDLCTLSVRWGDGPLRYLELLLFLNMTAEVEQLGFINYTNDKGNRWKPHVSATSVVQGQPS
jgi:hypothetical protein